MVSKLYFFPQKIEKGGNYREGALFRIWYVVYLQMATSQLIFSLLKRNMTFWTKIHSKHLSGMWNFINHLINI